MWPGGCSLEGVSLALYEEGICVNPSTIYRWADRYTLSVGKYTQNLAISVGGKWSCDETYLKILGLEYWLFTLMDSTTRFVLSWDMSPKKLGYDAHGLFGAAMARVGRVPAILVSDGLRSFQTAFRMFWRRSGPRSHHFREIHMKNERCNNNKHERSNGTHTDRLEHVRGLKQADSPLIRIHFIYYNFIRRHQSLGKKTPTSATGIVVEENVWDTLICNADLMGY